MKKKWSWYLGAILLLVLLWTVPVYAGEQGIQGLTQIGAGEKTVSLSWQRPSESVYYEVYTSPYGKGDYTMRKSIHSSLTRVTTSVSVPSAGRYYDVQVVAYDREGQETGRDVLSRCAPAPGKVTGIQQKSQYTQQRMKLTWDRQEAVSGYEVELYQYSNKARTVIKARASYSTVSMSRDQLYRIRVRGYVQLRVNGTLKKIYGPYGVTYTSLQPRLSFKGRDENSVTVNWRPVQGADSYAVFVSRSQKSGYQRVDIVQSPTAVIKNLKPNVRYYVLVRVNKRVGGVLYRSPFTYVYPVRIDTTGSSGNTDAGFQLET